MPSRYNLPHIDIAAFVSTYEYVGEQGFGSGVVRERVAHGRRVQKELRVSLSAADAAKPQDGRLEEAEGVFVEVELRRGTSPNILDMKTQDIRSGAAKTTETNDRTIALYVPDRARPVLEQILSDYLVQDTDAGNPKNQRLNQSKRSAPPGLRHFGRMFPALYRPKLGIRYGGRCGVIETVKLKLKTCARA